MAADDNIEMLARLIRTAEHQGAHVLTLQGIIARAAEEGATVALMRCGLSDDRAGTDIRELRLLLDAWRDTKHTARRMLVRWAVCGILALMVLGVAMELRSLP
jgi:hypothetical protein